jgi:hypothetical protein
MLIPPRSTLSGTGLADGLAADGQYFVCYGCSVHISLADTEKAIFDDGHHRQLPRLVKGPFRSGTDSLCTRKGYS